MAALAVAVAEAVAAIIDLKIQLRYHLVTMKSTFQVRDFKLYFANLMFSLAFLVAKLLYKR